jgi:trigger factor
LKIATEQLDDHQVKITVEVESDEFENAKRRAARKIAKEVKVPGFRPGKAPYPVIERQVGAAAILEEAIEILANDLYPKALDEAEITPYGPGQLENVSSVDPVTLEFITPLEAVVELGDYHAIRIPYELEPVSDEDVEHTLTELRNRQAVIEPVERATAEGDQVRIMLSGTRLNPQEGDNPVLIEERSLPIIIDRQDDDVSEEWPYPGFSQALVGMQAGDEKTIVYTFPEDAHFEALRGAEAEFHIKIEQVAQRQLPELDDEFAKTVSDEDTFEKLQELIRKELGESREHDYNHAYEDDVIAAIIAGSTLKYPPQMVDRELDDLISDLENRLAQQGLDLETYLKITDKDMDAMRAELRESAEKRLQRSLVLFNVATAENIKVNPEDVQEETEQTLGYLSQTMPEKEFKKINTRGRVQNIVGNIMMDMLIRQTIARLRLIAQGQWQADEQSPEDAENGDETPDESVSETVEEMVNEETGEPAAEPAAEAGEDSKPDDSIGD